MDYSKESITSSKGMRSFLSAHTAGVVAPVLRFSAPERNEHTETSSAEGHKDDQGIGAYNVQGEGKRDRIVQHEEEKAWEGS